MCDFYSWIEKGKKLYFLDDATIETRWPGDDIRDHIGHSAIEEIFPDARGGVHKETAINLPIEIAREINLGRMSNIAKVGGWAGARYDSKGHLCSPWWYNVEKFIEAIKQIKWLDGHGEIKAEWKIFDTRDAAGDAASDAASDAAWGAAKDAAQVAAWDAARVAAWDAAGDAARVAALYARCLIADPGLPHSRHATERLEVWLRGYGLVCDINGILYVYRGIA